MIYDNVEKTVFVGLKQWDSLLFFLLDIKLEHGNTSPAIIRSFRMKILMLFSLGFAAWYNWWRKISQLYVKEAFGFGVFFAGHIGERWVSIFNSVALYLSKGNCVGTQILGWNTPANLSWAAVVLKIRRDEPKGNFIQRALKKHNRNCHVFMQNFWQKPPSSICWFPKC